MSSRKQPPAWRQLDIDDACRQSDQQATAEFRGRLNELRAALISIDPAKLSIGEHRWFTIREAVMNVAAHDSCGRRRCEEKAADLAAKLSMTVGQWYEALRHAKRLGLVRASQRYQFGQRLDDAMAIDEGAISALVGAARRDPAAQPARTRSNHLETGRTSSHPGTRQLRASSDVGRTTSKELVPILNHSSSTTDPFAGPSQPGEQQVAIGDPRWGEVEEELFYSGMKEFRKATRAARASGASPDDALAIIVWWKPRRSAWGEYAVQRLFWRISGCRPGDRERASEGWPPPREGWRDPTKQRRTSDLMLGGNLIPIASATAVAEADDREARYGAELDAMSDADVEQLWSGQRTWIDCWRKHQRTGYVREELLARLAAKGGEP